MSVKAAGVGHFMIPTAPAAGIAVAQSASANTYGTITQIIASTVAALYITGVYVEVIAGTNLPTYVGVQLYITASTVIDTMNVPLGPTSGVASTQWGAYKPIFPPVPVATTTKILAATASSVASAISYLVTLECIAQSNVVDDAIAVTTVSTVSAVTGLTASNLDAAVSSRMATYTQPTGFLAATFPTSVASPTNITAGVITTATNLTNAPPDSSGVTTLLVRAPGVLPVAADYTAARATKMDNLDATISSRGTSTYAGGAVASVTGAVGSVSGNVGGNVTGSVGSVVGAVGSVTGLTASNLDATVSSRLASASYTAPDNADVLLIKAKTDNLPAAPSAVSDIPSAATNASAVLSAAALAPIASELKKINGVTVNGDGSGVPWGP